MTVRGTVYISGPMRGKPLDNYPAFRECAKALRSAGLSVVDPSEHFEGVRGLPRHKYLAADVIRLVVECNAIVLLSGWHESEGAKLEAQIALDRGYELFCYVPPLGFGRMSREAVEELLSE